MYQHATRFPAWMIELPADLHDAVLMHQIAEHAPDPCTACIIAAAVEEAVAERMRS